MYSILLDPSLVVQGTLTYGAGVTFSDTIKDVAQLVKEKASFSAIAVRLLFTIMALIVIAVIVYIFPLKKTKDENEPVVVPTTVYNSYYTE